MTKFKNLLAKYNKNRPTNSQNDVDLDEIKI
jgi:hypothetical protein